MGGEDGCEGRLEAIIRGVGQGNFTFVREKSGKSQGKVREKSGNFKHLWLWQPCINNMDSGVYFYSKWD